MTVKVRFAPSPTGRLHVGNVRTALANWLFAKGQGGTFVLRIDDTDLERSTKAFEDGIKADLTWLGMAWDETDSQSKRFAHYESAAEKLKAAGRLYPAYETQDELTHRRNMQRKLGKPPIYDRAALRLTPEQIAAYEAEGRKPHWRFKLEGRRVVWNDLVRGECDVDTASMSDPVLIREDGLFLYTLPSVVDDIEMGITHVIRGEDHVTNTGAQIEIFEALGAAAPAFAHMPLLVDASGAGLSKRDLEGKLAIGNLRDAGYEPLAVVSYLGRIGTSDTVEPMASNLALAETFAFEKMGRAPARFHEDDLDRLNAGVLHAMAYAAARPRLEALGIDLGERFWNAIRANLGRFEDAAGWAAVVRGPVHPVIEEADLIRTAAELLPQTLDESSWSAWAEAVKNATGAKGRGLFRPLRLAVTGQEHGPDMSAFLPVIDRERVARRLAGEAA
ncbi:MAG: glutamate--tRNA ligase [Caulobacteraceae bacterium]|nr:glutamate--tRNA ligase [Caulobacteraceae bacterium]